MQQTSSFLRFTFPLLSQEFPPLTAILLLPRFFFSLFTLINASPFMVTPNKLDLSHLPPIHILPPHLTDEELHTLEEQLQQCNAPLTYSYEEANLYLGDINTVRRCELELKKRGLWTKKLEKSNDIAKSPQENRLISVIKLKWLRESLAAGKLLDFNPYLIYSGYVIPPPLPDEFSRIGTPQVIDVSEAESVRSTVSFKHTLPLSKRSPTEAQQPAKRPRLSTTPEFDAKKHAAGILQRAQLDAQEHGGEDAKHMRGFKSRGANPQRNRKIITDTLSLISHKEQPKFDRKSTDEWEKEQQEKATREIPEYVKKGLRYACLRPHPLASPNDHFISLLNVIKLSRTFTLDAIGIRAYSTAIASIKAYPYEIISSNEIMKLPGCDGKISSLFHEYINSSDASKRTLHVVQELESNEEFKILSLFYGIWGVGAKTAREFYFQHGWKSLEDIIEFGWDKLTRVQQIGLKYYDEINNIKIPRWEVERIAKIVNDTANKLRPGYEYIICGGYRRGKSESGDVDMVISNRDEEMTRGGFTGSLVEALEKSGFVTHTLYLGRGGGFGSDHRLEKTGHRLGAVDNLEKAMVIWQEQELPWAGPEEENPHNWVPGMKGGEKKNPHPHRRVDIILSPPSTVGTAILGWTGATTYERDMRRFVEHSRAWKFDSGGVWDRRTGEKLEELGRWEEGESLEQCERRAIEGMGMPYFLPELRNTG